MDLVGRSCYVDMDQVVESFVSESIGAVPAKVKEARSKKCQQSKIQVGTSAAKAGVQELDTKWEAAENSDDECVEV